MLFGAGLLLMTLAAAQAGGLPPRDAKPLSQIIRSVEDQQAGVITEAAFDDGFWEVEAHEGAKETTLYLDPTTGEVTRQQAAAEPHAALPPKGGKPLSEIVKSVEDRQAGAITGIAFEDGFWEVTIRAGAKKTQMDIDPKSGRTEITIRTTSRQ